MIARLFFILTIAFCILQGCRDPKPPKTQKPPAFTESWDCKHTLGFYENGKIINEFDCPDAVTLFVPIELALWKKTPAVNGRLPNCEETKNGTAIAHYGGNPKVKAYPLLLPKLAYTLDRHTGEYKDLVVVIQIAQTETDTVVGYRYLNGGCGGSRFRNFHFLDESEIKKEIESRPLQYDL